MLLAEIDVASGACMGWTVIVDEAYSQFDFLRTIKHALMPWRPKDMTGRRMQYLPNAWMPSAMEGPPPRSLRISVDNYSSHLAKHAKRALAQRSEEHTSELQSLMRISYAVFCLKNK